MAAEKINSIDDYERFLSATMESWLPDQRTAFAAGMAERWLPAYDAFSKVEQWGDPASLHQMLEAVWGHLSGRRLSPKDVSRYTAQLRDSTPHMDDFDANQALAACVMLDEALNCCVQPANLNHAAQAALSGFEAILPDWEMEIEAQPRLWKQVAVRKEFRKQLWLAERIGANPHFDDASIQALRDELARPEYSGDISPYPAPGAAVVSVGITNQSAFEQYRRMVEADLRSKRLSLDNRPDMEIMLIIGQWLGRYSRRRQTIDGSYGRLADTAGVQALILRSQARDAARDAAAVGIPDWDPKDGFWIDVFYRNPSNGLEVRKLDQPHGYGPSIRRLWLEGRREGLPDTQAWRRIVDWARHRPAAWEIEDRRKKKGKAYTELVLSKALAEKVTWSATGDIDEPWEAQVNGQTWRVRLGDFPDDYMYYLVMNGEAAGGFHDWPGTWRRD